MKRPTTKKSLPEKERRRVLRFLAGGEAQIRSAAKEGMLLLEAGERGMIAASPAVLSNLVRERLVVRADARLSLSAEGRAALRRDAHPAAPFRAQHMELETEIAVVGNSEQIICKNLAESPLAQLARRRTRGGEPFLAPSEFRAGERLRADYTRGQIMPKISANWSQAVADARRGSNENGIAELTDAALAARQRVENALTAVGPELAGVLVDICCFLKGLEQVEMERGWPVRSAKVVLKAALAALSRHYEPPCPRRGSKVLHWGAEGYRPVLR